MGSMGLVKGLFVLGMTSLIAGGVEGNEREGTTVSRSWDKEAKDTEANAEDVVETNVNFVDSITVRSVSRYSERLVDAPAAVTVVGRSEFELAAPAAQVPRLLSGTVGVQLGQNGVYDFNLNVRGFNNALNRRVQVLVDGRNPKDSFTANPQWMSISLFSDVMDSVELVRGPSAALYGPNSFSGVLNIVTTPPGGRQRGLLRATLGELDTQRLNGLWVRDISEAWSLRVLGEMTESDDFSVSRNARVEYEGLPLEASAIPESRVQILSGSARFDRQWVDKRRLAMEWGENHNEGYTVMIPLGRAHVASFDRTWGRLKYNANHFSILGVYNRRDSPDQLALGPGASSVDINYNFRVEIQANDSFSSGQGHYVVGASWGAEDVNSANEEGAQTLLSRAIYIEQHSAFAQLDYALTDVLKVSFSGRWDSSDLHDGEFSPKGAIVYQWTPRHTTRLIYNEAFQVPTYSEFFLETPAGRPLFQDDLPTQLPPGVFAIPVVGLGNENLRVEKIKSFEVGYSGLYGSNTLVTVDYYKNQTKDFITDLLPGANRGFRPYTAPEVVPGETAEILNAVIPGLTNAPNGDPILVLSYGNTGRVNSEGFDLAVEARLDDSWSLNVSYSWFDFEIEELTPGTSISPNSPEHRFNLGIAYQSARTLGQLRFRWSDEFFWAAGLLRGPVPSFEVVDLAVSYDLSERWELALEVSNLLDSIHYEVFGGSLLRRRALVSMALRW